jgi:ribosomal protein L19E
LHRQHPQPDPRPPERHQSRDQLLRFSKIALKEGRRLGEGKMFTKKGNSFLAQKQYATGIARALNMELRNSSGDKNIDALDERE